MNSTIAHSRSLSWFETLSVAFIMFAPAVWVSSAYFLEAPTAIEVSTTAFSVGQNLWAGTLQSLQLLTALTFLYLRGWRFQTFRFSPSLNETGLGLALFALTALLIDIGFVLAGSVMPDLFEAAGEVHVEPRARFDETLFFYSLLNGFYEEFFFLTIVSAARHPKAVFLFSLILRVAFHTYQGFLTALLIGLVVGTLNYCLFMKRGDRNLYPFFVAHALADMLGLSLLGWLSLD